MAVYHNNEPEHIVNELIKLLPPTSHVLDLGCGIGRNAIPLAKAGHRIEGREKDANEIRALHERARIEGVVVETICTDMRNLRIGYDRWNAILAILALHLIPASEGRFILKNSGLNLLPGGYIALVMMTSKGDLAKQFRANFYPDAEDVLTLFSKWEIVEQKVDVVPCKTMEIKSGLQNERLTLLARKPT